MNKTQNFCIKLGGVLIMLGGGGIGGGSVVIENMIAIKIGGALIAISAIFS
jgi:hypothetical protein